MSSIFDAQQFLDSTTTEAAQRRDPLPASTDFIAEIGEPKARQSQGKKDPSMSYLFFDYPLTVNLEQDHPEAAAKLGVNKLTIPHSVSVDITENGAIDWSKGKNSGLRMLRDATNTNIAGQPWNPRTLTGRRVRIQVKHEEYPEGSGNLQERVKAVAKI